MLKLNENRKLQAVMGAAVTTTAPVAMVGYNDKTSSSYDGDAQLTDLTGTSAADICDAPAAESVRQIDQITLRNWDSVQQVVTIQYDEGGTVTKLFQATLETGEVLGFTHGTGWYVCTADGSRKSGAVQDLSGYQLRSEKDEDGGYVGMTGFAVNFHNLLGTSVSLITNANTIVRTYLFPDKSGTVALTDDVDAGVQDAKDYADAADATVLAAAEDYADGLVVGLWDDRGSFDASGNAFPSSGGSGTAGAILKGDIWTISVSGTLGGHAVTPGDTVRALVDSPGMTDSNWAIAENNIGYVPESAANKDASGGYPGLSGFAIKLKNALGTITSTLASAATTARTWTLPDKSGTVAMTSDITGTNSGTNTGDQTITLTGNVTGSGTGSFATTIASGVVTEAMQVLADNTTHNVSTSKHGYVPKAPNDATKVFLGDATWGSVPGGTSFISATGGTITTDGNYKVHTFTSDGTFTITSGSGEVESLVVGGGGGGSGVAAGGGAGGVVHHFVTMYPGAYPVRVGAGGAGGTSGNYGTPGDGSCLGSYSALGGQPGGKNDLPYVYWEPGGSGGGNGANSASNTTTGGRGWPGQGYPGGAARQQTSPYPGGGGGGATAAGGDGSSNTGGAGGAGYTSSITGSSVTYAGGGGGGTYSIVGGTAGAGGSGGGGAGSAANANATSGTANTGGGGGGAPSGLVGGAGGSGVVIVRYQFQ